MAVMEPLSVGIYEGDKEVEAFDFGWNAAPWDAYLEVAGNPDEAELVASLPFRALPNRNMISLKRSAQETGQTVRTVAESLSSLASKGLVRWDAQEQGYELTVPVSAVPDAFRRKAA